MSTPLQILLLALPLLCGFYQSTAEAQVSSEIRLLAQDGANIDVDHVLGHSLAATGNAVMTSTSRQSLCQTPCRFVLRQPMELRIENSALRLEPDGSLQNYQVTPARRGLGLFARASTYLSGAGIIYGGLVVYMDRNQGIDNGAIARSGRWSIGLSVPILIASIVGMVLSRGRVRRVDGFEF